MERSSGILLHISSLPGRYGIGDFGLGAYNFVDFLEKAGQKNWQILPLGITSFGDSPYQSFSAFAGNPYFIDLNELINAKYIKKEDVEKLTLNNNPRQVNYNLLYIEKMKLLKKAYSNARDNIYNKLKEFYNENHDWTRDFALFMALKSKHDNKSWLEWDRKYQEYNSKDVLEFEVDNQEQIYFWIFTQYLFYSQWERLKSYANSKGVKIIGDLPIYVSADSADIWSKPYLFKLDEDFQLQTVSGVPPDDFTSEGQLWGNPIYNWDAMEDEDYKWWIRRIKHSFDLFDTLRIDHFRGFESFWEVQYGQKNAINGKWSKGPGMKLFNKIREELGDLDIIVEDLGFITGDVRQFVKESTFPNMKVLQFAFNSLEESEHMPHRFTQNMVVYTGTHDNPTLREWFKAASKEELLYLMRYFKLNLDEGFNFGIIRGAWSSCANLAIAPMQDLLDGEKTSRMNTPSTIGENWTWRITQEELTEDIAKKMKVLTKTYWR